MLSQLNRAFLEDMDLAFLVMNLSDRNCGRAIKKIEVAMTDGVSAKKLAASVQIAARVCISSLTTRMIK